MSDHLRAGIAAGTHLLVSLEDEWLVGMAAEDLGWLPEVHRRAILQFASRGGKPSAEAQAVPRPGDTRSVSTRLCATLVRNLATMYCVWALTTELPWTLPCAATSGWVVFLKRKA
mgnify:CR=1 FL=1